MSFEEFWQENKSFVLILLGGFVVFLTAWFIVTGSVEDDIRGNVAAARSHERKAKKLKLPSGALRRVETNLEELRDRLEMLKKELAYVPQPGFTLEGIGKSPDVHFNEMLHRMLRDVVEVAASLDIRISPDLGLHGVTPRTRQETEWYLNGLDVVNRIGVAAIASQVETVEPITIQAYPKKRGGRRGDKPFVEPVTVTFHARGGPASIDSLLRGLQLPGARLVVTTARISSLEKPEGKKTSVFDEGLVGLDATVQALRVDPEGDPSKPATARR